MEGSGQRLPLAALVTVSTVGEAGCTSDRFERFGEENNCLLLPGFEPTAIYQVASRYTDYAIPAEI